MKLKLSSILPSRGGGSSSPASKSPSRWAGSMKVGTKIFTLVGFCLALLGVVAGTGIWQMNKIGVEMEGIAERDMPLTEGLTQITIHQLEQAINLERAYRTAGAMEKNPAAREEFEKSVQKFEKLTVKIEKEFEETITLAKYTRDTAVTEEGRKEFKHVLKVLEKLGIEHIDYDHVATQAFKLIHADNLEQARTLLPKIEAEQEELDEGLEEILFEVEKFTKRAAKAAKKHEKFALKLMLVISAIALILGIGFSYLLITRSIIPPLEEVVTSINALTSGDLSLDVKFYNDDEIGAVAKACTVFRENLARTKQLEKEQEEKRQVEEKRQAVIATAPRGLTSVLATLSRPSRLH